MTLMRSISGMRGTIGGVPGEGLTPVDLVQFASAYAKWLRHTDRAMKVVIGRDGRVTGKAVKEITIATLRLSGCDVVDLDLSTTPTVEMAVPHHEAGGGIILTASHNPAEWNALKFLNDEGEFISHEDGLWILKTIEDGEFTYPDYTKMGKVMEDNEAIERHVEAINQLSYVNVEEIQQKQFKVVIDPVNSTGALAIPVLLKSLGVKYTMINDEITGQFAHDPEPLPKNLKELSEAVVLENADLGISVDPDVDRLVLVCEDGSFFGEEYTLVAVADLILTHRKGDTVSNLSSSRALRDVSLNHGVDHHQSAVGEVHVVKKMKEVQAVIGGEGNGGVILPELHNGRDALVGIALFLQLMVEKNKPASQIRSSYPSYVMAKEKIQLTDEINADELLEKLANHHKNRGDKINETDGVKVDLEDGWIHMRKSNTEPIIRLYVEAPDDSQCKEIIEQVKNDVDRIVSSK